MSRYPSPTRPPADISPLTGDLPYYIEERMVNDLQQHIGQLKKELNGIPTVEMREKLVFHSFSGKESERANRIISSLVHYCLEHENDDPFINSQLLKENPFDETKKKKTCVIF